MFVVYYLKYIDDLRLVCSPHVVCIVESWLDVEILDSEIALQGYYLCRLDRTRHGGSVLIYVNNMFTYSVLFKGTLDFELLIQNRCSSI